MSSRNVRTIGDTEMSEGNPEKSLQHQLAIFSTRRAAEQACRALVQAGFAADGLSLFVQVPNKDNPRATGDPAADEAIDAGGVAGAEISGAAGGIGGLLAGLGLLAIPGVGPMLAVGPLAGALTGTITGSAIGGVAGSLVSLGISEAEAIAAEKHIEAGRALVMVICGGRRDEARAAMRSAGAPPATEMFYCPSSCAAVATNACSPSLSLIFDGCYRPPASAFTRRKSVPRPAYQFSWEFR